MYIRDAYRNEDKHMTVLSNGISNMIRVANLDTKAAD